MRRGYTLFEILLVVALVVILAGMTIPSIEGMYSGSRLQAAADQITSQWSAMRTRAIVEGRPYRFSYQPGTGDFQVAPDGPDFAGGGDSQGGDNGGGPLVVNDSLPRGIVFATANAATPTADGSDASNGGASPTTGPGGSTAAVFLPDGTAQQDAEIRLSGDGSGPMSIRLRALTGGITTRWIRADENP